MQSLWMWPILFVAAWVALAVYAIAMSFYIACIKGSDPPPTSAPCESIEAHDVPGPVWDAIEATKAPIAQTGAAPLGFIRVHAGPMVQFSSVWWANDGEVVIYGSAAMFATRATETKASNSHITCSSALSNGTQIQTTNQRSISPNDTDRFRVRSFPAWMSASALLEIHEARLAHEPLPVRPIEASLTRIVAVNNESVISMREDIDRAMGTRASADGRQRMSPRVWVVEVVRFLPPVGTVLRLRRRTSARRELRELGLLHLWKKPT